MEKLSVSLEDYIEEIYNQVLKNGQAKVTAIASALDVKKASVTGALNILAEKKLINYAPYAPITLTAAGETIAKNILMKHENLSKFFMEVLGVEKEEALENLNNKIKGAELLGKLLDVMDLKIQAKQIENELADLKEQYSKRNMAEKITDVITSKKSKPKLSPIHRLARFVSRKIIAKMSKKVQSILDLSDSLDTLTSINENVDELIAMKVPYGETKANYEKLTNYLYRANRIHSQINKKMQSL